MGRIPIVFACGVSLALSGCATAPRAPATSLSQAGIQASNAFATDVRSVASQLAYLDAVDAFATTLQYCQNTNIPCEAQVPSGTVSQQRRKLAEAVTARANALDALSAAYAALGQEAASNGSADLAGAADRLVAGVNRYTSAVTALGGAPAALMTAPVGEVVHGIASEIGERRQRQRILAGSRAIAAAVQSLRSGLDREAQVFDTIADYLVTQRTAARLVMMRTGLASRDAVFSALVANLGVTPTGAAGGMVSSSVPVQTALDATVRATSQAEVLATQQSYRASLQALDALIAAHRQLEQRRSVSLDGVNRALGQLETAIDAARQGSGGAGAAGDAGGGGSQKSGG
jgi:hypothetical protein